MFRIASLGLAASLAAVGCVADVPPDASLSDPAHPANPNAPAATQMTWDDPLAAPTSQPTTAPTSSHHDHGGHQ